MKPLMTLALLLASAAAQAAPADAKKLARFDIGFAKCEARFEQMRGHRDEAYLALWRINPDARARKELATLRKGSLYKKERQVALKTVGKETGAEADKKLANQCQATWAEAERNKRAKTKG